MVPQAYSSFFMVMAEGGAALLGLLFVAVSMRRNGGGAPQQQLAEPVVLADAALFALADGFVISAAALHPGLNVAYPALAMSALGLVWAFGALSYLWGEWAKSLSCELRRYRRRVVLPNLVGLLVMACQIDAALRLAIHPGSPAATGLLAGAVLGYYAIALVRAWALVGGAHYGPRAALSESKANRNLLRERHYPPWPRVRRGPRGPSAMTRTELRA
jgi:hypothetical protein